jgi:hypothetical protein
MKQIVIIIGTVFGDVTPCSLKEPEGLEEHRLQLQGRRISQAKNQHKHAGVFFFLVSYFTYSSTLKLEAII